MPTIMITGGGSGLGRDLCLHFARRKDRILIVDRDEPSGRRTLRDLTPGTEANLFTVDVSSPDDVDRLFADPAVEPVDILINNAGLQHVERLETFPVERWSYLIDVMLKGSAWLARAALPGMRARGFGRIINIGSIHSLVASPFKSAYVAAKHGLLGLTRTLALETADSDITVNAICPSYIRTPLVEAQIAAQAELHGLPPEQVVDRIMLEPMPKRAFITSDEIAGTIEFLLSPAARNITGQAIVIDGGWTIR